MSLEESVPADATLGVEQCDVLACDECWSVRFLGVAPLGYRVLHDVNEIDIRVDGGQCFAQVVDGDVPVFVLFRAC